MIKLNRKVYLGSNSPRRKELLGSLGVSFDVIQIEEEETFEGVPVRDVSGYLAEKKARASASFGEQALVLCADTVVILNEKVLGKPVDRAEAMEMLKSLSGVSHLVSTSVCLRDGNHYTVETDVAEVQFKELSQREIAYYVDTFKPFDKAGSYGIQEWIGMVGVDSIKGSFYTIMGLPTHLVYRLLLPYMVPN
jgi:septum formation protein